MAAWQLLLAALLVGVGTWLLTARGFLDVVLGLVLAGNGVNLLLFALGRLVAAPPLLPGEEALPVPWPAQSPLAQAFVLTAIVIGLGTVGLALALARRVEEERGSPSTLAVGEPGPPPGGRLLP